MIFFLWCYSYSITCCIFIRTLLFLVTYVIICMVPEIVLLAYWFWGSPCCYSVIELLCIAFMWVCIFCASLNKVVSFSFFIYWILRSFLHVLSYHHASKIWVLYLFLIKSHFIRKKQKETKMKIGIDFADYLAPLFDKMAKQKTVEITHSKLCSMKMPSTVNNRLWKPLNIFWTLKAVLFQIHRMPLKRPFDGRALQRQLDRPQIELTIQLSIASVFVSKTHN